MSPESRVIYKTINRLGSNSSGSREALCIYGSRCRFCLHSSFYSPLMGGFVLSVLLISILFTYFLHFPFSNRSKPLQLDKEPLVFMFFT
ncbi:hypothetical protein GDO78_012892 [Eleutherodactylus coqui]|uniref:Uncharacterized protein n=1 Tax=Eleutherodactylus coqui TaxID=57060 RepID=A0A8J6EXM1_ELECQ|nr:hypothetical protein GDO78_012892 [Eleutherodactylus coqui]